MLNIFREFTKMVLILVYWLFPIYIWRVTDNTNYFWLFILSLVLTCLTLVHYENILALGVPHNFEDIKDEIEKTPHRTTVSDLYPEDK